MDGKYGLKNQHAGREVRRVGYTRLPVPQLESSSVITEVIGTGRVKRKLWAPA